MGQKTITVRGRIFAVESKSGSQTADIIRHFEKRTDSQLDTLAAEYRTDKTETESIRNVPDSGYRFIGQPS